MDHEQCLVCLDLDRNTGNDHRRWKTRFDKNIKEYFLSFEIIELQTSSSQCAICLIVSKGIALMSEIVFDLSKASKGRFVLQTQCPLEIELLGEEVEAEDEAEDDDKDKTKAGSFGFGYRLQYYGIKGGLPKFLKVIPTWLMIKTDINDSKWAAFGVAKDVPAEISTDRCISVVKNWIDDCRTTHKTCDFSASKVPELPARLLAIDEPALVTLIDTRDGQPGRFDRYATLSHCWGRTPFIQTTNDTIGERKKGIPWSALPTTFQDAITVARKLELKFIWIDSLCIIQDNDDDWKEESSRMAAIYSHSHLNIAATGSSDGRGGCLSTRSIEQTKSFMISPGPEDNWPIIMVRPSFEVTHKQISDRRNSDRPDKKLVPLLSRAWVFQERHLAPRTLHFHPSEMIMECKTKFYCECSGLNRLFSRESRPDLRLLDDKQVLNMWIEVVEEFSKMSLTHESDRLPALTGVATVFRNRLKCNYLAGLWSNDLQRGLLWDVTRYSESNRLRKLSTPSWSWASMSFPDGEAAIIFPAGHDNGFRPDCRFTSFETDNSSGYLSVRGAVRSGIISLSEEEGSALIFDQDIGDLVKINLLEFDSDVTWSKAGDFPEENGAAISCLLVGSTLEDLWQPYHWTIVLRDAREGDDTHERIGVLNIDVGLELYENAPEQTMRLI